jgi:ribosomal protein L11 methyltransferase
MHVLRIECRAEDKDRLLAELWERGTLGVIEDDLAGGGALLRAFFDAPFDVRGGRWEPAEDRDWVAVAQSQWEPLLVGARFYLTPPWCTDPAPVGRLRLEMRAGLACGTGWAPATQLALEAMETRVLPGMTVLDIGSGSGILTVAAELLGAARVYACDVDLDAVAVARDRFRSEGLAAGLFAGSAGAVLSGAVDFVVANIDAPVLAALAPEIGRILKPGGHAALGGFTAADLARLREAYPARATVLERSEWRLLAW